MSKPGLDRDRIAEILEALEHMAAGELHRRAPISPAHDEIDAVAYAVNVLVGELHLTVDRLAQAQQESQQANQQKSLFLRNVSHELRTPLAAMLTYTALLAKTPLDNKQQKAVERIHANGDALLHLIEDLLDVARIEAGKLQLILESVSPAKVAADVVQSLLLEAKRKGVVLMLSMPPDLPDQIVSDGHRLRQILMNLVGNALKFTDQGEVVVSLRTENAGDKLVVEVSDTGVGLSEADQEHLFSAFVQTHTGRGGGGAGLGLVLAKQLSQQLGGDLRLVSSKVAEGSRFRVELPITRGSAPSSTTTPAKPVLDLKGLSVLFAEDNADILTSYATLLEVLGCEVETVGNGLEAVKRGLAGSFDVILMDMQMPVLDGLEATRRLRSEGFNGPIIALSAHAMEEDRQRFYEAGCNDHIAKPIKIENFIARLSPYRPSR